MGQVKFGPNRAAIRVVVIASIGLSGIGLMACSEDVPTDYTAAHREAFLAACSRPIDDPRLLSDICGCVYDRMEGEMPFDEFQRISERLATTPAATADVETDTSAESEAAPLIAGAGLPDDIARLVADCFTLEADL